ncbi:MAG: DUF2510 domain-containing protein [Acidimicrobiia bacterium]|nr:DUF2510 domain-containing protein [Acidimicrobiia bacterium]
MGYGVIQPQVGTAGPAAAAGATPAGWYPDPEKPGSQRYFDGSAWTEHRS